MMKYRVHHFEIPQSGDQSKFEHILWIDEVEIGVVVPQVALEALCVHRVNFLLLVE
jgi:hypothetical protein